MAEPADREADPAAGPGGSTQPPSKTDRVVQLVESVGGALTVALALAFTFVIAVVALGTAPVEDRVTIAAAAFSAIGTVAGTYFGIRLGADGKAKSDRQREETQAVVERVAEKVGDNQVQEARQEVRRERSQRQAGA
jgi:hypothetical protein